LVLIMLIRKEHADANPDAAAAAVAPHPAHKDAAINRDQTRVNSGDAK